MDVCDSLVSVRRILSMRSQALHVGFPIPGSRD